MQVERDLEEIELILWGAPESASLSSAAADVGPPEGSAGAAAAMAFVAFLGFVAGLGLAVLLLL